MIRYLLFLLAPLFVQFESAAQSFGNIQDPITSHYLETMIVHNPAFSSASGNGEFHVSGQNLANTFDTLSDNTFMFAFQTPSNSFPGGVGGQLVYVYSAFNARIVNLHVNFSYKVVDDENQMLAVGGSLGGGMRETLIGQGPLATPARTNRFYPDLNAGIWYKYKGLFLGVGATHITSPSLEYTSLIRATIDDVYYLSGGYRFEIDGIEVIPSFMGRFRNNSDFISDALLKANYQDKFGLGLGYRTDLRRMPVIITPGVFQAPRFQQALVTGTVGFGDFILNATYTRILSEFAISPDNFEMTLTYRFKKAS